MFALRNTFFSFWRQALSIILALSVSISVLASDKKSSSQIIINMLDYIQRDYVNAVDSGEVINEFEFLEMKEFSQLAYDNFQVILSDTSFNNSEDLSGQFMALKDSIDGMADRENIGEICRSIKGSILALKLVKDSPSDWPDLRLGSELYSSNCSACHGEKGMGDGPASVGLEPSPSNFIKPELHNNIAPFQAYNTIQLGIPGTSMMPFTQLSEKEVWALSFYLLSLPYSEELEVGDPSEGIVSLGDASTLSNRELIEKYGMENSALKSVRSYKTVRKMNSLSRAKELLILSLESYEKGDHEAAFSNALNAYLEGIEPIEKRLAASDAKIVGNLEKSFMTVRTSIKRKEDVAVVQLKVDEALIALGPAVELLDEQEKGLLFTTFISASILVREGLEAFLIIISIIAILKSMEAKKAVIWIHAGWILALLVGASGFFFMDLLMQWDTSSRELMEGSLTLFASAVLVFMGFWLHSKTEIGKWRKFVEVRISSLVNGNNMLGLALFSFIVVFREAFESVIFLSSISVDSSTDNRGIWLGVLIAGAIVATLSFALLRMFEKVNLRKVFLYSSSIIVVLSVILAGKGIHALQESGLVGVSSLPWNFRMTLVGIYPTFESMLAQFLTIGIIFGLWLYNKRSASSVKVGS